MTFQQAATHRWNPFDVTKIWPEDEFPLMPVGTVTLNRNPANYFQEVEQAAFAPARMVPGIEASPDKMLQGGSPAINNNYFLPLPSPAQVVCSPTRTRNSTGWVRTS